jgi:hypothetical protein
VLLNGLSVKSCTVPAIQADGSEITTVQADGHAPAQARARPAAQAGEPAAAQHAEAAAPQASGSLDTISSVAGPLAKQFAPALAGLTLWVVLGFLLGEPDRRRRRCRPSW